MANRKTIFDLDGLNGAHNSPAAKIRIIGSRPHHAPYVKIEPDNSSAGRWSYCIKDKDLERFAVNILRALKSKHLKTLTRKS